MSVRLDAGQSLVDQPCDGVGLAAQLRSCLGCSRNYASAIVRLADQATLDQDLGQRTSEIYAMFRVATAALINRFVASREAHAERLGITLEEVDTKLYPPLPDDDVPSQELLARISDIAYLRDIAYSDDV